MESSKEDAVLIDLVGNDHVVSCVESTSLLEDRIRSKTSPILSRSKSSSRKKKVSVFTKDIEKFALTTDETIDHLKEKAKASNLVITSTSRNPRIHVDRIGFGLPKWIRNQIPFKVPVTLFKFGIHKDGFFNYGKSNSDNVTLYHKVRTWFSTVENDHRPKKRRRQPKVNSIVLSVPLCS